jgi:hypothetical protein
LNEAAGVSNDPAKYTVVMRPVGVPTDKLVIRSLAKRYDAMSQFLP